MNVEMPLKFPTNAGEVRAGPDCRHLNDKLNNQKSFCMQVNTNKALNEDKEEFWERPTVFIWALAFVIFIWIVWIAFLGNFVRMGFEHTLTRTGFVSGPVKTVQPPASTQKESLSEGLRLDKDGDGHLAALGQAGDAFGGFNALASALACLGVVWATMLQRITLKKLQAAEKLSRAETRFEHVQQSFFELLKLSRELADRVVRLKTARRRNIESFRKDLDNYWSGPAALDAIAASIRIQHRHLESDALLLAAVISYQQLYDEQPSRVGPFIRILFQTFQLIDLADIPDVEKIRLSKIARGQISEGTVLLLALNSLTWRGWDFVDFIQRYGLLEHMHPKDQVKFLPALRAAFNRHAFLGSTQRKVQPELNPGDMKPNHQRFDVSAEAAAQRLRLDALNRK